MKEVMEPSSDKVLENALANGGESHTHTNTHTLMLLITVSVSVKRPPAHCK